MVFVPSCRRCGWCLCPVVVEAGNCDQNPAMHERTNQYLLAQGASWGLLGPLQRLGAYWASSVFVKLLGLPETSWGLSGHPGASWGVLGALWGRLGFILAYVGLQET